MPLPEAGGRAPDVFRRTLIRKGRLLGLAGGPAGPVERRKPLVFPVSGVYSRATSSNGGLKRF